MEKKLAENKFKAVIDKEYSMLSKSGMLYRNGIITREICIDELRRFLGEAEERLLRNNRLRLHIDSSNFPQFELDWQTYQAGSVPSDSCRTAWLLDVSGEPKAADPEDQRLFFTVMERFHIPTAYFTPIPGGIPSPSLHAIHRWNSASSMGTDFCCVDDGGLLAHRDPVGKTFRLINEQGLEAVLTIIEDRRTENRTGMDFDEQIYRTSKGIVVIKAEFLSEGCIEGYTAKARTCNPEVLIRTGNGKINWLAWYENEDDCRARRAFPLWQDYYRVSDSLSEKRNKILDRAIEPFFCGEDDQTG